MYLKAGPLVIGVDENGFGALAGPLVVTAAACTAEQNRVGIPCRDSKRYGRAAMPSRIKRDQLNGHVNFLTGRMQTDINNSRFICYHIVEVSPDKLCRWGYQASLGYAFRLAVASVRYALRPHFPTAIIDGVIDHGVPLSRALAKADDKWPIVSLASCLGKTRQLQRMHELHELYPQYGFHTNHGYGVATHIAAIKQFGLTPHHRERIITKMDGMHSLPRYTP